MTTTDAQLPNGTPPNGTPPNGTQTNNPQADDRHRSNAIEPRWAAAIGVAVALATILSIVRLHNSFPDRYPYAIALSLLASGLGAAYVARTWRLAGSPFTKKNWAVAVALGFYVASGLCGMAARAEQVQVFIEVR